MLSRRLVASITFFGMLVPALSISSNQESLKELRDFRDIVSDRGYSCRESVEGRYLGKGQSYTVNTTLYAENKYLLIAAGNVHVKDLDIVLYDENDNEISRDKDDDPTPIVSVSPKWDGKFRAKVTMYKGKGYSNLMICWNKI